MQSTKKTVTPSEEKRDARRKKTAECFTPLELTNEMLDKLVEYSKNALSDNTKTFLDPACGNGNLLIEVLKRKLENGSTPEQALETIFGCDIMRDNVNETRLRLLKVISKHTKITTEHIKILARNIVCTPLDKFTEGSLTYLSLPENETFNRRMSESQALNTLNKIVQDKLLDGVEI